MEHEKIFLNWRKIIEESTKQLKIAGKMYSFKIDDYETNKNNKIYPSKKHYIIKATLKDFLKSPISSNTTIIIKLFNKKITNFRERWQSEINNNKLMVKFNLTNFIPKIIDFTPYLILYEYIRGKTFFEYLIDKSLTFESLKKLVEFFHVIHQQGYIFGDCRLTNFIYTHNNEFFIVDLEDFHKGIPLRDFSNLLCSFIDFYPGIFERKEIEYSFQKMVFTLINYMKIEPNPIKKTPNHNLISSEFAHFWSEEIIISLENIGKRRSKVLNKKEWEEIKNIIFSKIMKYSNLFL